MGYDCGLKIKELDEKYSPFNVTKKEMSEDISMEKKVLIGYCMHAFDENKNENKNKDKNKNTYTITFFYRKIAKELLFQLKLYFNFLKEEWKIDLKNEFDESEIDSKGYHKLYFRGWEYAKDYNDTNWTSEEIENYTYKELFNISIISTGNRFSENEEERKKYFNKLDEIGNILKDIEYDYWTALRKEFYFETKEKEDTIHFGDFENLVENDDEVSEINNE